MAGGEKNMGKDYPGMNDLHPPTLLELLKACAIGLLFAGAITLVVWLVS